MRETPAPTVKSRGAAKPIEFLGLDEKSIERGHSYASILADVSRSRVLNMCCTDAYLEKPKCYKVFDPQPGQRLSLRDLESSLESLCQTGYLRNNQS